MNGDFSNLIIDSEKFSLLVNKLRSFCLAKGFVEVHTQNRLSILAACEDPTTIQTYNYGGQIWPLPQTGQMWLEWELLTKPDTPGYFCVSTSYRYEPNPVPGRHMMIFPMFEFELKGGMDELIKFEKELLEYVGFEPQDGVWPEGDYCMVAKEYDTVSIEHEHEHKLCEEHGSVYFLKNFPEETSPFWNMARNTETGLSHKVDVIIGGMETIGSAERSTDPEVMKERFLTISNGEYAGLLYKIFGEERVNRELDAFLALPMIQRSGGGIGISRLIRALEQKQRRSRIEQR